MTLKFKGTTWKIGTTTVVTIPYSYVKPGMISLGDEYTFAVLKGDNDGRKG